MSVTRQLTEIAARTGKRPTFHPLSGATSSDLYRLDYGSESEVLRVFRTERWDTSADALSARELEILRALESSSLPTPRPIARLIDNGVVMSFLNGAVRLPAAPSEQWLAELAATLACIHSLPIRVPFSYESWNDTRAGEIPEWWQDSALWQAAQQIATEAPGYEPRFIHRDYHPVNVLWEGERITGIVDWINACVGPVGIDVAHCRLNLALMYGLTTADDFLEQYGTAAPGYVHEYFWDIEDALGALPEVTVYPPWVEFGLEGLTDELVRQRLQSFLAAAVGRIVSP